LIAVVDYGAGNLRSVCNALDLLGQSYALVEDPSQLKGTSGIILPGVGHFRQMMEALLYSGLALELQLQAKAGTPLFGICLGMQVLFESSEEAAGIRGLGLLPGEIKRFHNVPRVPHMGWNDVRFDAGSSENFYFANSFYAPVSEWTTGVCEYGVPFSATVRRGNVSGVQFHPEKSGEAGRRLLGQWCEAC
jgi:imidazole glycerol-phosphate synthase subunit HisH